MPSLFTVGAYCTVRLLEVLQTYMFSISLVMFLARSEYSLPFRFRSHRDHEVCQRLSHSLKRRCCSRESSVIRHSIDAAIPRCLRVQNGKSAS